MVFQELASSQAHKVKSRADLESELFDASIGDVNLYPNVRDNEGEAAEHGIFYDDTGYDYMQHIRDLNAGSGNDESFFVEAKEKKKEKRCKGKMSLEEALRESSIQDEESGDSSLKAEDLLGEDILPSKAYRRTTYQDQQDVPDALAGFQPDMDPRLRETLEALDDDAYVDDEEDFFGEIARDGREVSLKEFENNPFPEDNDEEGWESDTTEKATTTDIFELMPPPPPPPPQHSSADIAMSDAPEHGDGDWMKEFSKFKQTEKWAKKAAPQPSNPDLQSSVLTGTSMTGGRKKKRKGAMTSSTGYSMTSSSLFRTEGQTLLDARFDKIEEDYGEEIMDVDDGTASVVTESSRASRIETSSSQAPSLVRADFDSMMDDFLGGYSMSGKKRVKKGGLQSGLEQLDEVRQGLGPARIKTQKAS